MKRFTSRTLLLIAAVALTGCTNTRAQNAVVMQPQQEPQQVNVVELPPGRVVQERPTGYVTDRTVSKTTYNYWGFPVTQTARYQNTMNRTPIYASGVPGGTVTIVQQAKPVRASRQAAAVAPAPQYADPAATQYYGNPSGNCAQASDPSAPVAYPVASPRK